MIPQVSSKRLAFLRVQLREAFPEMTELRIHRLALAQYLRGRVRRPRQEREGTATRHGGP